MFQTNNGDDAHKKKKNKKDNLEMAQIKRKATCFWQNSRKGKGKETLFKKKDHVGIYNN